MSTPERLPLCMCNPQHLEVGGYDKACPEHGDPDVVAAGFDRLLAAVKDPEAWAERDRLEQRAESLRRFQRIAVTCLALAVALGAVLICAIVWVSVS